MPSPPAPEAYAYPHLDLVAASQRGDGRAQRRLYELYSRAMFNLCFRMMNNREDAEDMLQEAFSDAFAKLGSFRGDSSFGAWLKRIALNRCLNELKRRKAELVYVEDLRTVDPGPEEEPAPQELELDVARIHWAVAQMADGFRVIFSLYAFEGYDHKEIAQILNITESTSKSQYMRAKRKVREILAAAGPRRT